ncbi:MAG: hypothetical protein IJA48_03300, partial [Oscillospiraceae bacterium]|nr:hypothetical protein [Oscillospiraceae bacterium]
MKNGLKRLLSWLIALVLVVSLLPAALPVADAAGSLTVSDANIGLSWSDASNSKGKASWSASGDNVTGTATGYTQYIVSKKTITTTLTITNNHSDSRTLQFSFTLSGGGSVSGIISGTSGNYSEELGAGASVTITLTSPSGSSTNTLSLTGIQLLGNEAVSSTFKAPVNGSYTVDGTAITADTVLEKVATESYALVATPASGYKFYGWWSNTSSSYVSTAASASLKFAADPQLEPKFIPADQALFSVGGMTFATLTEAGAYAATSTNKTIIPISNGTVYGSHTIPAGVTLLVPFNSGNTLYTTEPDCTSGLLNNVAWVQPTPYRTLTLDSTAKITVNGAISVSAQHAAANGGKDFCGAPTGPCGFMAMESGSKITLNSGAKLYAWGFITGAGTIDALNGSKVYENFQFTDFRGGTVTTDLAEAKTSFPMSQYYVQNIEVPITFYQGAVESLYTSVFMSQMCPHGAVTFIGTGGLFIPGQGGYVTKTYDGSRDRMVFDVYENATINSISMTLSGTTVNSADYLLPINGNIDINIHSGVGTMAQSIALLPGTTITVDQGATINLASTSTATTTFSKGYNVVLYDYDQWMGGGENVSTGEQTSGYFVYYKDKNAPFGPVKYAPGKKYTRTNADLADAKVDINGTIQANGYVYSTLGGANVTSSQGTGKIVFVNGAGTDEYVYEAIQTSSTYVPVRNKLIPALLKNADGSFTETAGALPGDTFVYDLTTGKWVKEGPFTVTWKDEQGNTLETDTVEKNTVPTYDGAAPTKAADANGHYTFSGWTPAVTAATADTTYTATFTTESHSMTTTTVDPSCDAPGSVTHTCTVCGYTTSETTDALGHSYSSEVTTVPTCTEAGVKTFTCATCGHSYTESVAATGHVNTTTTTVEATCTVDGSVTVTCDDCGTTVSTETIVAPGHSYTSEVTTAPTCTETGVKTYTCTACGHSYTEIVAATGHVNTTTETVEPTCTEAGSTTVTCACGEVVSVTEIPATGHVNTTTTTVDATCTENGTVTVTCDDCGEVLSTETIDALGHSYDEGVVTAPTCTEGGYTTFTCNVCGHTEKGEETEATDHDYTYTDNGDTHTITCLNGCDYSLTEGHTYTDGSCICGAAEHIAAVTDSEGNTVTYASLMEAIAVAEAGDTVSLLKDITLEERIILDAEDDIILDLNGKTLTTCGTADNYDIVIKGDLTICDSSEEQTGTLVVPGIYGIGVSTTEGSSLTIEGGNFTQIGDYYLIGSWGTVTISGGSFYAPYCTVNAFSGTAYISGGSFRSDASDSILLAGDVVLTGGSYDRDVQEFCADEYITGAGENETYTVIPCVH